MVLRLENDALAGTIVTTTELNAQFISTAAENISWYPGETPAPVPTRIRVTVNVTPGTGTTQITVRVRHGNGITGAVIGTGFADDVTAAVPVQVIVDTADTTGDLTGYSITVQQTSATANGTVNTVSIELTDIVT